MRLSHRKPSAFTLVELLVVIGIIAVLIGILLPVLGRVRGQASAVACQSNLRSIGQLVFAYAAENKGSLPWGQVSNRFNPSTGAGIATPGLPVNPRFWMPVLADAGTKKPAHTGLLWEWTPKPDGNGVIPNKVFRCPAVGPEFDHGNNYGWHMVIFATPQWDLNSVTGGFGVDVGGGLSGVPPVGPKVRTPLKINQLYPDNALLWDQPAIITVPSWHPGFPFTFIDGGQLLYPLEDELRYRFTPDPSETDPALGQNFAIDVPSKSDYVNTNTDATAPAPAGQFTAQFGQIGVPRFRHGKNNQCNVLFADGSVRVINANFNRPGPTGATSVQNEFLRKYIMLRPSALKFPTP